MYNWQKKKRNVDPKRVLKHVFRSNIFACYIIFILFCLIVTNKIYIKILTPVLETSSSYKTKSAFQVSWVSRFQIRIPTISKLVSKSFSNPIIKVLYWNNKYFFFNTSMFKSLRILAFSFFLLSKFNYLNWKKYEITNNIGCMYS